MGGESKTDYDPRAARYDAGMIRAVESGFDTVAWKCVPKPLKVTYPPPDGTPLCVPKESFAFECPPGYSAVSNGCIYTDEEFAPECPPGQMFCFISGKCKPFKMAPVDASAPNQSPRPDLSSDPFNEPYAAEPPKGFFARYWWLIVVLVLVLVFVMLYLMRRKTAHLV